MLVNPVQGRVRAQIHVRIVSGLCHRKACEMNRMSSYRRSLGENLDAGIVVVHVDLGAISAEARLQLVDHCLQGGAGRSVDGVDVIHALEGDFGKVVELGELRRVAPLRRRVAHEEQSSARIMKSLPKLSNTDFFT